MSTRQESFSLMPRTCRWLGESTLSSQVLSQNLCTDASWHPGILWTMNNREHILPFVMDKSIGKTKLICGEKEQVFIGIVSRHYCNQFPWGISVVMKWNICKLCAQRNKYLVSVFHSNVRVELYRMMTAADKGDTESDDSSLYKSSHVGLQNRIIVFCKALFCKQ